jgi:2Fe-2S ferredoxin
MPNVVYKSASGETQTLEVAEGTSVMQAAVASGLDGIVAECGGSCMCATCHVYVEEARLGELPQITPNEEAMLDSTASERKPNSRLSCQIQITAALEGLVVEMPETQI